MWDCTVWDRFPFTLCLTKAQFVTVQFGQMDRNVQYETVQFGTDSHLHSQSHKSPICDWSIWTQMPSMRLFSLAGTVRPEAQLFHITPTEVPHLEKKARTQLRGSCWRLLANSRMNCMTMVWWDTCFISSCFCTSQKGASNVVLASQWLAGCSLLHGTGMLH